MMTDRDHFAAAALTGFASQLRCGSVFNLTLTAKQCYELADAMLRERAKTNLDAAPAVKAGTPGTGDTDHGASPEAIARTDADRGRTDKADFRPGKGTGDTPAAHATHGEGSVRREGTEPVAWAVMLADGERIYDVYATEEEAKAIDEAVTGNHGVVPLYRKPPLTDAERQDIRVWLAECLRQASTATEGCNEELAERWQGRAKRAAAMIERLGGVE